MFKPRFLLLSPVLLLAVSAFAVACGDDDDGDDAEAAGASGQEEIPLTAPNDAGDRGQVEALHRHVDPALGHAVHVGFAWRTGG